MSGYLRLLVALLAVRAGQLLAAPSSGPAVVLDNASFVGTSDGTTNKFLGIPFAQPPVGSLRFRLPVPSEPYIGNYDALSYGAACVQQTGPPSPIPADLPAVVAAVFAKFTAVPANQSEDCLFINVVQPAKIIGKSKKLPVIVSIYGGGFETGDTSIYDGGIIVNRSIELGQPVIYASMNYRLNAFGFLPGRQVKKAGVGNIGLEDQRLALRWIQKYIGAFGGDPQKVTIWGASAGSISVALQMITNGGDTEGLFQGGFMQSGSYIPVGDIASAQEPYDMLVQNTGCENSEDSLECLRGVPLETLLNAINLTPLTTSFQSLNTPWLPRADGRFLVDNPQKLVLSGNVAPIPFVNGDSDDEGTLFALYSTNITTDDEFRNYITRIYLPNVPSSDVDRLLELYSSNVTQGSPFNTGAMNAITRQFKRSAAFQGDLVFQGPRRLLLSQVAHRTNVWSYSNRRLKTASVVGSFHGSDTPNFYGPGDLTDILINFINHFDPNGPTTIFWPKYNLTDRALLTLVDGNISQVLAADTFRMIAELPGGYLVQVPCADVPSIYSFIMWPEWATYRRL